MARKSGQVEAAPPDEPPPFPRPRRRRLALAAALILVAGVTYTTKLLWAGGTRVGIATAGTPHMDPAVGERVDMLYDLDADVRIEACRQLGAMGARAAPAAPELVAMLDHRSSSEQQAAADALVALDEAAIPALVDALMDDSSLAGAAARTLARMGDPGVLALLAVTRDPTQSSSLARSAATGALGTAGRTAVPLLADAVRSGGSAAVAAARALEAMRPDAAEATDALFEAVCDPSNESGEDAALALRSIGTFAAVSKLAGCLAESDPVVSARAVKALARMDRVPLIAVDGLLGLLRRSADPMVRGDAAIALGSVTARHAEARSALLASLAGDADQSVRIRAALALGCIGCTDPRAIELTRNLSPDPKKRCDTRAVELALMCLRAGSTWPPLDDIASPNALNYFAGQNDDQRGLPEAIVKTTYTLIGRWASANPVGFASAVGNLPRPEVALTALGASGRGALPTLFLLASSEVENVRTLAVYAIASAVGADSAAKSWLDGPEGKAALAALRIEERTLLRQCLYDPLGLERHVDDEAMQRSRDVLADASSSESDRLAAADILIQAGELAQAQPVLLALLGSTDYEVRENAGAVLAQAGKPMVPVLKGRLHNAETSEERQAVIRAIGKLREYAGPAVPTLIDLCDDPDPGVRGEAALALWWIRDPERTIAPVVARALLDTDPIAEAKLSAAGSGFGPEAAAEWVRMLESRDPRDREAAAKAFASYWGPVTPDVERALASALLQGDAETATAAASLLLRLGSEDPTYLVAALEAKDPQTVQTAVDRLAGMGSLAVPQLRQALKRGSDQARQGAVRALGRIGRPAAQEAIPDLRRLARSWRYRSAAAEARDLLARLEPPPVPRPASRSPTRVGPRLLSGIKRLFHIR